MLSSMTMRFAVVSFMLRTEMSRDPGDFPASLISPSLSSYNDPGS